MAFQDDLRRFGPEAAAARLEPRGLAYCARLTASHYENFSVVTWLTPREYRPAFQSIYAFCRWSDDLGDEVGDPERSLELLAWWRGELRALYQGEPRHPVMVALTETVSSYRIPIDPFEALIDAFEQDQTVTEYQTYSQLAGLLHAVGQPGRSSGTSCGRCVYPRKCQPEDATCTALQLANFWQDVARDLAIGRIYLPRGDRERFRYDESDLRALQIHAGIRRVDEVRGPANPLPVRSRDVRWCRGFPGALAVDIDLFSRGGLAILDRIEARGFDVLSSRPALTRWTKIGLLGRALIGLGLARIGGRRRANRQVAGSAPIAHELAITSTSKTAPAPSGEYRVRMEPALAASYQFCGQLARREARNFHFAFCLLPRARRESMYALYAFMRHTDDLADSSGSSAERSEALRLWQNELNSALAAEPVAWPGLMALADTVSRWGISPSLLYEVIEGVSMDLRPRTFGSFDELADYCYHVASAVGLCCIHIWGYRSDDGRAERLAEACGIALQLTNILRDVREDARNGRVYIPQDEMTRFGVQPPELEADQPSRALHDLLVFQAQRVNAYYEQARGLVTLVDPVGRPVLLTIVGIYRALLDEIIRRDYNVLDTRVAVPTWRKAAIAMRALPQRFVRQPVIQSPTLVP